MREPNIEKHFICGFAVSVNTTLGHLWVLHDGSISWDALMDIKDRVWGQDARAIEAYPERSKVVNSANIRHLWLLGPRDFCPDLLGDSLPPDGLEARLHIAWAEAKS
ncbi:hypothetical protein K3727_09530 [Rhodobacteraceae bacterium M382]|nr:hypothetical protein K3727_09530 [Rhodobacteraceae bacterium M382]